MIDSEELLGQLHAYANNRHHSFVTLQQMARESAAAIEELRAQREDRWVTVTIAALREELAEALAQIAAKDAALTKIANYKGTYVGGTIFMAEVARQALAAPAQETDK